MTITQGMRWAGRFLGLATVLSSALLATGCSSIKSPGSASHAGLTIRGHSYADTVLMTRRVFAERGFKIAEAKENRMVLERDGSKVDQAKFGGWDGSHVSTRIKLDIEELGADIQYLRLDVYSVSDAGNMLEDENRVMMFSSRKWQEMLEEIQARLDGTWVPPETKE
jgi:FtsZ-binding cell division protein ZapB